MRRRQERPARSSRRAMDVRIGLLGAPRCALSTVIGLDLSDVSQVPAQPSVQLGDRDECLSTAANDPQLWQDLGVEEASANADAVGGLGRRERQPPISRGVFHTRHRHPAPWWRPGQNLVGAGGTQCGHDNALLIGSVTPWPRPSCRASWRPNTPPGRRNREPVISRVPVRALLQRNMVDRRHHYMR
jgi:hypothetical protein